jgi:hypothetical protein
MAGLRQASIVYPEKMSRLDLAIKLRHLLTMGKVEHPGFVSGCVGLRPSFARGLNDD